MNMDQLKGVLQVLIPVLTAYLSPKYIPADQLTGFDAALVTIIMTAVCGFWSARTTKTNGTK